MGRMEMLLTWTQSKDLEGLRHVERRSSTSACPYECSYHEVQNEKSYIVQLHVFIC